VVASGRVRKQTAQQVRTPWSTLVDQGLNGACALSRRASGHPRHFYTLPLKGSYQRVNNFRTGESSLDSIVRVRFTFRHGEALTVMICEPNHDDMKQ